MSVNIHTIHLGFVQGYILQGDGVILMAILTALSAYSWIQARLS